MVVLESTFAGERWRLAGGLMGSHGPRSVRIGLDVGGTKIFAVGADLDACAGPSVVFSRSVPTERARPQAFLDRLADFVRGVVQEGRGRGLTMDNRVGVGMPGRYVPAPGGGHVIAPGTAPNLGMDPNDFDGVDPAGELARRLPECSFFVHNDAVAQMRFALETMLRDPLLVGRVKGQKMCYLGPGTGLGGGFAEVSLSGKIFVQTDGHVFDIVVDPNEVSLPLDILGSRMEIFLPGIAEEMVSGKAISSIMGQADRLLAEMGKAAFFSPHAPLGGKLLDQMMSGLLGDEASRVAHRIAEFEGTSLGRVMEKIHQGEVVKSSPSADWPEKDKAFVRGIRVFVLGGSVRQGAVGPVLIRKALGYLSDRCPGVVFQLLSPPTSSGDAGALGAAMLAGNIVV